MSKEIEALIKKLKKKQALDQANAERKKKPVPDPIGDYVTGLFRVSEDTLEESYWDNFQDDGQDRDLHDYF